MPGFLINTKAPRWAKMTPGWRQDESRWAKMSQDDVKMSQDSQDVPRFRQALQGFFAAVCGQAVQRKSVGCTFLPYLLWVLTVTCRWFYWSLPQSNHKKFYSLSQMNGIMNTYCKTNIVLHKCTIKKQSKQKQTCDMGRLFKKNICRRLKTMHKQTSIAVKICSWNQ